MTTYTTPRIVYGPAVSKADANYKSFLLRVAPREIRTLLTQCFANGPAPGGMIAALGYFEDNPQHPALLSTVPVVEECERYMPGLQAWLQQSGFGDDLSTIKAFVRWAEIGLSGNEMVADFSNEMTARRH